MKSPQSRWPGSFAQIGSSSSTSRWAAERGLLVVSTIGVLEAAAGIGLIDLGQAFEEVKKSDFWISPTFLDERLALFLDRRKSDPR